jgi:UDP-N-acetylglucosamine--dolichyl-phosphate N-acetylglucosaminephosphotransferase
MLDILSAASIASVLTVSFLVTFAATPIIGNVMRKRGITGRDVHKSTGVRLPEMCGVAILIGLAAGASICAIVFPSLIRETAAFMGTVLIAGVIGFVDDLRPLNARIKPLLTAVACLPILILGTYYSHPLIPFVGPVSLTIIYPIMIPVAIAVTSNAVNMMDVMNGAMPGTVSVILVAVTAILLFSAKNGTAALSAALLGALLAFYYFNRYPAKVFDGDTGSLAVGAALGALAILGNIEAVMVVALIPHIMNAFYGLASVGGLYERREIRERPIRILEDGRLQASTAKAAPITLVRILLAAGPLGEREIVREMIFLTLISSFLALLTFGIMLVGRF